MEPKDAKIKCYNPLKLVNLTIQIFFSDTKINKIQENTVKIDQQQKVPRLTPSVFICKNSTLPSRKIKKVKQEYKHDWQSSVIFHYITFCAGALLVTMYNRKEEIILYIKDISSRANIRTHAKQASLTIINFASQVSFIILIKCNYLWKSLKTWLLTLELKMPSLSAIKGVHRNNDRCNLLLKKLKELGQERNNLSQLLIAAVQENKNIRLQCQVESLAKNRLMQQIQDTQKMIKDNRTRYVNFQQLYLVTQQENIFLKTHIKKLVKEKEEAEVNLKLLVSQVYQSMDPNLKAYCTKVIVKAKESLAGSNENTRIMNFLLKYHAISVPLRTDVSITEKKQVDLTKSTEHTHVRKPNPYETDIAPEADDIVPFGLDGMKPKLRGLPGEYVWTVKDKDGIIEKLYEYDCGDDFDNGDNIRRIREYTVYHDKDCLLDFANSKSTTIIHERSSCSSFSVTPKSSRTQSESLFPPNRKFLTESPIFQKFLANNKNNIVVTRPRSPAPSLLCG